MNIEVGILIQIIASSVSLAGIILGFVFTWLENRRGRYVEIITNQTIKNMLFLRENAALFSALIKPEIIIDARDNMKDYKFRLLQTTVNIESMMKYRFDKERDIINVIRQISKLCLKYYEEPNQELKEEIRALGESFYIAMSLYDYSDWQYVKVQAKTKPYKDFPDYDKIYDEQKKIFQQSEKPIQW